MSTPSTVSRRVPPRRRVSASASVAFATAAAAAAGSIASAAAASTRTTTGRAGSATAAAAAAAALVSVPVTPPPTPRSVGTATTRRRGTAMPPAEAEPGLRGVRHTSRYFSPSSPASGKAEIESSSWTMRRRSPRRAVVPVTPFASSSSSSLEEEDGVEEEREEFAPALVATPDRARGRKTEGSAEVKTKRAAPPSAATAVSTGGKVGRKRRSPSAASESSSAVEEGSGDKVEAEVERTSSFGPLWAGSLRTARLGTRPSPPSEDDNASTTTTVPVHTLILGTHPSVKSLSRTQYYAHPMNAFWWIAGDALGFRRDTGVSPSSGRPYGFASSLRHHGAGKVLPYERQVEALTSKGFALWDLIGSCRREGSLDQDITEEVPNDVRGFCAEHPEVGRIVLANGASKQLQLFLKHFRDWWDYDGGGEGDDDGSGSGLAAVLVPGESVVDKMSKRYARRREDLICNGGESGGGTIGRRRRRFIEVEAPMSVSPAAARFTYEEKRDDWERFCYVPGLRDRERLVGRGSSSGGEVL